MDTSNLLFPKPKDMKHIKRKHDKVSDNKRYSILTNNLKYCIICGKTEVNLHEIFFGNKRELSKKYGLVIPLCSELHHDQVNCRGIHFDIELCLKWQKIGQQKFMQYYNKTIKEFRDIFGKNYL